MLGEARWGVGAVRGHEGSDFGDGDEGEEFEVALYVGVGGAEEELECG